MRLFVVLVAFMMIFSSCGSDPAPAGPSEVQQHAVPARTGRAQPPAPGEPLEKKSIVKFEDNSIDEYTISIYNDKKETQLDKQEKFSASGQLVEEITYSYYEEDGLLSTKITKGDDNRLKGRVVYEYNGKNLVKESFVGRNGKVVSSYQYTYDNDGNMLTRVINNAAGVKLTETVYNYQNGLVTASETKDNAGNKISAAKNEYNADGKLTKQTVYNIRGAVSRIINAEWQNGREVKNEQLSPNGQVQLSVISEYGPQGELLRKIIDNREGGSKQTLEYEYTFQNSRSRSR